MDIPLHNKSTCDIKACTLHSKFFKNLISVGIIYSMSLEILKYCCLLLPFNYKFLLRLKVVLLISQQFSISRIKPDSQILLGTGVKRPTLAEKRVKTKTQMGH